MAKNNRTNDGTVGQVGKEPIVTSKRTPREVAYHAAESYWKQQDQTIQRRIEFQLQENLEQDDLLSGLRSMYNTIISSHNQARPLEHSPFDYFFDEVHNDIWDPVTSAVSFIYRWLEVEGSGNYIGDFNEEKMDWTDTAIHFQFALKRIVKRYTKQFIRENPDLLANAPEFHRMGHLKRRAATAVTRAIEALVVRP